MQTKQDKILEVRKRLRDDFSYYAEHAIRIRTKDGAIMPLVLNEAQKILVDAIEDQWAAEGKVRIVLLKARQMGASTCIGAWLYWRISQNKAQRAFICTHSSDATRALFDQTRRFHQHCPPILKPSTKYASRRELFFDVLDSSVIVGTAGSESIGRGETISACHVSELAYWPSSNARDTYNGLMQAVPNRAGTAVVVESTAAGVSGLFYELWQSAVKGENGYVPIFIPWFVTPEYRLPVPDGFARSPEEEQLVLEHGLDNEQLMFRRNKIGESGRSAFLQEYPSNATEAFLTTGRPIFNPEQLTNILTEIEKAPAPKRLALEGEEWLPHPRGELLVYRDHSPSEVYTIGADTAAGIRGRDYSVAQVLDGHKRQVAVLRGHFDPDYYATLLFHLGSYYNDALVAVENNNHGILTCTRLYKDLTYPNCYTEIVVDKQTDEETEKIGFSTNQRTKPLIIDKLRAALRDNEVTLNDATTVRELLTYVVNESGAMSAEASNFDDCVMSLALASYVHEGVFEPVPSLDEYYVEML